MEGKAIFERPTAINEANAGQWPHCFTRFVIHFDNQKNLLRIGDDWSICSMDLCQCTDSDRMVYGLGKLLGKSSGALTSGIC